MRPFMQQHGAALVQEPHSRVKLSALEAAVPDRGVAQLYHAEYRPLAQRPEVARAIPTRSALCDVAFPPRELVLVRARAVVAKHLRRPFREMHQEPVV
jgi:hypothetical protein